MIKLRWLEYQHEWYQMDGSTMYSTEKRLQFSQDDLGLITPNWVDIPIVQQRNEYDI